MAFAKVLVVDDSPAELANLVGIVNEGGWLPVTATNGKEAVAKAKAEKPGAILMDIVMPEMDGYEACRTLRADPETKNIPIVFVSSKNQKADQLWATMQGGKALIGKPFEKTQILTALKALNA
jgi:twitching motility two-component system response regulator PilH